MIDFEQILPEDFDQALVEHVRAGGEVAAGWNRATASSKRLGAFARALAKRHGINPHVALGLVMVGVNVGTLLAEKVRDRRVILVH